MPVSAWLVGILEALLLYWRKKGEIWKSSSEASSHSFLSVFFFFHTMSINVSNLVGQKWWRPVKTGCCHLCLWVLNGKDIPGRKRKLWKHILSSEGVRSNVTLERFFVLGWSPFPSIGAKDMPLFLFSKCYVSCSNLPFGFWLNKYIFIVFERETFACINLPSLLSFLAPSVFQVLYSLLTKI